jgi:glycosidase
MFLGSLVAPACAQPVIINGSYDPAFGSALAIQTDATGFGLNASELDAAYGLVANGNLYLFLSGNLQNNGNNINIFIGGTDGQTVLNAANPGNLALNNLSVMNGSRFSPGFSAVYAFNINNTNQTLTVSQYNLTNHTAVDSLGALTETGNIVANGMIDNSVVVGFNNTNAKSQAANVGAGSTGLELMIPLSLIGNPSGPVEVLADINGYQEGYLSNQLLPGLAPGTANLASTTFNFGSTPGEYFTVPTSLTLAPVLTVNGINGDYGTTHVFVNEVSNDAVPLSILFTPNAPTNVTEADVFSNLNRRDRANRDANGDGVPDGILPPDGNSITTGDTNNYYAAYAMTPTGQPGQYSLTLNAQKTGVYRLTARYKMMGDTNWHWYSTNAPYTSGNRRDFSIVVSPKKATGMVLYELAVNNVSAQGDNNDGSQRSTFTDLYNGPGSRPYDAVTNRFNLNYVTNLGVNWLWLEPVHPIGTLDSINSPYCVRDYFQISPGMSKADTVAGGLAEFQGFVAAANAAGVSVMMDEPFDHTARDAVLENEGVVDFGGAENPGGWQPNDLISSRVPEFYSPSNSYCTRASSAADIAPAPDEGEFGKWSDVIDIFHGVYAARVCENPEDNNNYLSADDWFDYGTNSGSFDGITQGVWKYYANCLLYWLAQTGCTNGTPANLTSSLGVGGMRADFAEGVPPQCWEYIINTVRCQKWDFVFLAESLSDSTPTYRSSRDFDVVNDSVLYQFRTASSAANYQAIFNSEQGSYGQCLMLWNTTSHDVGFYYPDPYQALLRYMIGGAMAGVPHLLYGQDIGTTDGFGFSLYTTNGSEIVPDLYAFNSLQPAAAATVGNVRVDQLYPLYASVGRARQSSPALQSANRMFLSPASGLQPDIYAVAKFTVTNGSPNFNDVVFAFVNLAYTNNESGNFNVNLALNGTNIFGIDPNRFYNAKNLAAYLGADSNRGNDWLWGSNGVAGTTLLASGVPVSLNAVPASSVGWTNAPYEAQYLKLYDVTPPATLAAPVTAGSYVIGNSVTFTWQPLIDPVGGVAGYQVIVGTSPGAADVFSGVIPGTTLTVTNAYGTTLYAGVSAINNAGVAGQPSASSTGVYLVNPAWVPVLTAQGNTVIRWNSVAGMAYQLWSTTNLADPFTMMGSSLTATGPVLSSTNLSPAAMRFYRVQLILP